MISSRREFLKYLSATVPFGALVSNPWFTAALAANGELETPDFSERNILRSVAGLRPLRSSGIRIELESLARQTLIHNYGHGGSGFTLCWGSAEEVAEIAIPILSARPAHERSVAIIGAGVIGLTTALTLVNRGFSVCIYAAQMSPQTTSDLAGAQWSPSFISKGRTAAEIARYHRIVEKSYRAYSRLNGIEYGVSLRANYLPDGFTDGLQEIQPGVLEPFKKLRRLPFAGVNRAGTLMKSWLIEPPIFMPKMISELRARAVTFKTQEFSSVTQIERLEEKMVINCTGLGAAKLVDDRDVIPMKGQLVHLKPKAGLDYLVLNKGYVFCRRDAIVVGGSYEKNVYDVTPTASVTKRILQVQRDFFGT